MFMLTYGTLNEILSGVSSNEHANTSLQLPFAKTNRSCCSLRSARHNIETGTNIAHFYHQTFTALTAPARLFRLDQRLEVVVAVINLVSFVK
jgi:hypothetical protein